MCGLTGIFAYSGSAPAVDPAELQRIRDHMHARGPDGAGLWIAPDKRIGLAHRRLAIIDLTTGGAQPMASVDGRYQIVFNGEIYNYLELREQLQRQGFVFHSNSDTEVLLQMYASLGEGMLNKLRGMYAFAIWDAHEHSLFLARDPFGIKPLYLSDDGHTLRFASQVKALLAGGKISRAIDPEGEAGFRIWGHIPEPRTLYSSIRAFTAGHWMKIDIRGERQQGCFASVKNMLLGTVDEIPSCTAPASDETEPASSVATTLRAALLDTVRRHLIADVPVGVFLSSGIDSTTLAALASECGGTLRTLTLGFEEYRGTPADETMLAEEVARKYGAKHQTVWLGRKDFEHAVESFIEAMDQPSMDGLNTWLVARAAAESGLKVAISGLGGDEFFGGYPSFRQLPKICRLARPFAGMPTFGRLVRRLSAPLLRQFTSEKYAGLLEYGSTWEGAYLLRRALHMPWEIQGGEQPALLSFPGGSRFDQLPPQQNFAVISCLEATRYMRNQLLRDSDWAGMAHSIELRVPLVDIEFVRFLARAHRFGQPYTKLDLAAAAKPALPYAVIHRPKTGFTVPVRDWMLQGDPAAAKRFSGRGLRGWAEYVYQQFMDRAA